MAGRPFKSTRHWLIQAIQDNNMTYLDVAEKTGVTTQAVYYWTVGQRTPRPNLAKKISNILGVDWTKFYERT